MKRLVRTEYICLLVFLLYLYFYYYQFSWKILLLCLFIPDISMVGYMMGNKVGAIVYNCFHTVMLPVVLFMIGMLWSNEVLIMVAMISAIHICMDRSMGYGLKLYEDFKQTHLS